MRQLIYESVSTDRNAAAVAPSILRGARPFNGVNGVSGLLCASGDRFLQIVEGPDESVDAVMRRIQDDPRHHRIDVIADDAVEDRAFGDWAMAYRDQGHPAALLDERVRLLVARAPADIRERFRRFVGT